MKTGMTMVYDYEHMGALESPTSDLQDVWKQYTFLRIVFASRIFAQMNTLPDSAPGPSLEPKGP